MGLEPGYGRGWPAVSPAAADSPREIWWTVSHTISFYIIASHHENHQSTDCGRQNTSNQYTSFISSSLKSGKSNQIYPWFGKTSKAANFEDRPYCPIWKPNVNNNIYILIHEYSSTEFELRLFFKIVKFWETEVEILPFGIEIKWSRKLWENPHLWNKSCHQFSSAWKLSIRFHLYAWKLSIRFHLFGFCEKRILSGENQWNLSSIQIPEMELKSKMELEILEFQLKTMQMDLEFYYLYWNTV